jgi:peptidoglycan/LPS O-acetylase OafA/YrhL
VAIDQRQARWHLPQVDARPVREAKKGARASHPCFVAQRIVSFNYRVLYLVAWSLQPLVVAVMLLQVVYWGAKSWAVCRTAVVRFIAQISYALYLYHQLAGKIVYVFRIPHLGLSTIALTLLMSTASYYFVERPFMRMRDRQTQPIKNRTGSGALTS